MAVPSDGIDPPPLRHLAESSFGQHDKRYWKYYGINFNTKISPVCEDLVLPHIPQWQLLVQVVHHVFGVPDPPHYFKFGAFLVEVSFVSGSIEFSLIEVVPVDTFKPGVVLE